MRSKFVKERNTLEQGGTWATVTSPATVNTINAAVVLLGSVASLFLSTSGTDVRTNAMLLIFTIFWPYAVSVALYWMAVRDPIEVAIYAMLYPFSLAFLLTKTEHELEDFFNVPLPEDYGAKIAEDAPNVLPIKALLVVGSLEEKKRVARRIVTFVTHGIEIEENMSFLNAMLSDPHMDVVLYASQAKEDIEKYFEGKLTALKGREYSLEYALNLYHYIRTGIPKGRTREALLDKLRSALEHCPKHAKYFEMMFFVTGDEDHLEEAYKLSRDESYLRRWRFEKLRKRRFDELKRHMPT